MTELLTAAQMRAIEAAAIASGEVTGLELMERAGQGVVDAILAEWPEFGTGSHGAVILCGPGNNGGDGFVVARLLKDTGWDVNVFFYGDVGKLPPDARVNYERWGEVGDVKPLATGWMQSSVRPTILVDAIFGTGLSRPLRDDLVDCFWELVDFKPKWMESAKTKQTRKQDKRITLSVSVDIASGFCADSGKLLKIEKDPDEMSEVPGRWPRFMALAFNPDLTVTFHRPKQGHYLSDSPHMAKRLVVAPLMPLTYTDITGRSLDRTNLVNPDRSFTNIRIPMQFLDLQKRSGHKFDHGHAFILTGSVGRGGAARLAARGALRIGAGVVTVGCPGAALLENAIALDAVMTRKVSDAATLTEVLGDARINALCLGPGFGTRAREAALVRAALESGRAVVLDADALTLLAGDSDLFGLLHDQCVLTPHVGEFARLFPGIAAKLDAPAVKGPTYSKVDATREAAALAGCVVLFKGPDTVIADPSGLCSINAAVYDRTAPWLATAGSGDVLAGFIAGLLARGFAPMQAAETAAWLHVECARSFGPGLIAEDLPKELPKVFRNLLG